MISVKALGLLLGTVFLVSNVPDVASYSKYGRTCKDIGCLSNEVCVMAEDPCSVYSRDNCGRYPTCKKANAAEAGCASIVCQQNEYCRSENGVPTCVQKTTGTGYESAGVSYVNGQKVEGDEKSNSQPSSHKNPYANANAPALPDDPLPPQHGGGYHQTNTGGLGYPPYPSNTGSRSNSGYPPYPAGNQAGANQAGGTRQHDLGYPPYPTHDRMPMPGQSGYPQSSGYPQNSGYPPQPYPGYPQSAYPHSGGYHQHSNGQRNPAGQYPPYQTYPQNYPNQNVRGYNYNTNTGYRRNGSASMTPSTLLVASIIIIAFLLPSPRT